MGGIIREDTFRALKKCGVAEILAHGTSLLDIVEFVRKQTSTALQYATMRNMTVPKGSREIKYGYN